MDRGCSSSSEQTSFSLMSMFYRRFGPQLRTRAGCQNLSRENGNGLALKSTDDLTCRHQGDDGNAGFFNRLSASFFAVDECQNSGDRASCRAYGIDGPERGATGGYDIFDYRHAITLSERTFEQLAGSVSLCLFPHGECSQGVIGVRAGVADRVRDGIGTQRQPANRIDVPLRLSKGRQREWPDDRKTLRAHRREPRVDVKCRLLSRSKCELTAFGRALSK